MSQIQQVKKPIIFVKIDKKLYSPFRIHFIIFTQGALYINIFNIIAIVPVVTSLIKDFIMKNNPTMTINKYNENAKNASSLLLKNLYKCNNTITKFTPRPIPLQIIIETQSFIIPKPIQKRQFNTIDINKHIGIFSI